MIEKFSYPDLECEGKKNEYIPYNITRATTPTMLREETHSRHVYSTYKNSGAQYQPDWDTNDVKKQL